MDGVLPSNPVDNANVRSESHKMTIIQFKPKTYPFQKLQSPSLRFLYTSQLTQDIF